MLTPVTIPYLPVLYTDDSVRLEIYVNFRFMLISTLSAKDLPIHPCFELVDMCVQGLSSRHGRHLVILRK